MSPVVFRPSCEWEFFQRLEQCYNHSQGLPGGSVIKNPPTDAGDRRYKSHEFEPWVGKIPLEKEMAAHSSVLAWEIPRTEEPGRGALDHGVIKT